MMPVVDPNYDSGHGYGWKLYFDDELVAELVFDKWEDIHRYYFNVSLLAPDFDLEQLNNYDVAHRFRCVNQKLDMIYDLRSNGCSYGGPPHQVLFRDMRDVPMIETTWDRWKTGIGVVIILALIAGDIVLTFTNSPISLMYRGFWCALIAIGLLIRIGKLRK